MKNELHAKFRDENNSLTKKKKYCYFGFKFLEIYLAWHPWKRNFDYKLDMEMLYDIPRVGVIYTLKQETKSKRDKYIKSLQRNSQIPP